MSIHSSPDPSAPRRRSAAVERPVQLTVDGGESVADERLSDAPTVVVRRLQSRNVLDEVDAEQKRVVLGERSAQHSEEPPALLRVQVPDRASQEGDQPAVVPGEHAKIAFEVTDDRMHEDPRVGGRDRLRARSQGLLAHVERDEAFERACCVELVQQETDVVRTPGAELDERPRLRALRDRARPVAQDLTLAAREVVVREPRDLVVQTRAALV